jgi:beta-N-acetylhexosaminidase
VVGVAGVALGDDERRLFRETRPLGFILFARNCDCPEQIQELARSLRAAVDEPLAPVLIDQEGGRVSRLKPPVWPSICALRAIGELAAYDLERASEAAWLHARLIAADLLPLGITVNCAPVLDLGFEAQTQAIGDRAFSDDPALVASLGRAMIQGYLDGGILPVIKHLPGHGRALVDSHLDLPRVAASLDALRGADWLPFRACADAPLAMTAHILFDALDPAAPATQSSVIIQDVIRGEIGFEGALLSDDLSMQALGGTLFERAAAARRAGCDLALHCNGNFDEMSQVLAAAGPLEGQALARVEQALARRRDPLPFDRSLGRERLDRLLDAPVSVAGSLG